MNVNDIDIDFEKAVKEQNDILDDEEKDLKFLLEEWKDLVDICPCSLTDEAIVS